MCPMMLFVSLSMTRFKKLLYLLPGLLLFNMFCNNYVFRNNANLPYISSFVEELGCFPKITHTNHFSSLRSSDPILCLKEEVFHENCNKTSILTFKTIDSLPKRLVLEPYQMEINFPYMISSLKTSVSI